MPYVIFEFYVRIEDTKYTVSGKGLIVGGEEKRKQFAGRSGVNDSDGVRESLLTIQDEASSSSI